MCPNQVSNWDTHLAGLVFNKGTDKSHDLSVLGVDTGRPGKTAGVSNVVTNNFAWGSLDITNQTIHLVDGVSAPGDDGLYVNFKFDGADLDVVNSDGVESLRPHLRG